MITLIILLLIANIGALFWNFSDTEEGLSSIMLYLITTLFWIVILCFALESKPTAMDVYKGNTALEVTYRDGIPIDSVVVFKKN